MSVKRINLISGPRNISTALMYSFGNRTDTSIIDEPMYAYYLNQTGRVHPGRDEIIESLPTDLEEVIDKLMSKAIDTPYYFIKGMAHHYLDIDLSFILNFENVILIRDPKKLIFSFSKVIPEPKMSDIGIKREFELYHYLISKGKDPVVLDSGEVLVDPESVLKKLCKKLEIPYSTSMLSWEKGTRPEDGVWAKYWYSNVHKSTGFQKNMTKNVELPTDLIPLYEESIPYYQELFKKSLKA